MSEKTVALITMGCARNEVDSEELAGRLEAQGWTLVSDPELAQVVMVNTCGFVDIAKADSINTIIEAAALKQEQGITKAVVAVGVFTYTDEAGTEAFNLEPKVDQSVIDARVQQIRDLVDELMVQRAQERIGELVEVVIESFDAESNSYFGPAGHQGLDGSETEIVMQSGGQALEIGQLVQVRLIDSSGVDLISELAS